MHKIC